MAAPVIPAPECAWQQRSVWSQTANGLKAGPSRLRAVRFGLTVGAAVTTAGGAVAAYIAAERYEFLWVEYTRTASELRRLPARRTAADGSPLSESELVAECEQVISVQNQAWMAKRGEEDSADDAAD